MIMCTNVMHIPESARKRALIGLMLSIEKAAPKSLVERPSKIRTKTALFRANNLKESNAYSLIFNKIVFCYATH